jgi:hypothetical protein
MQSNESIDKLTLELLINKNQYNKYLSQTNPEKYKQHREHLDKIAKYNGKIHSMFSQLMENPEKQITTKINESFDHFVRTCINHFEMKELDYQTSHEKEIEDDDDVLFGNCESISNSENEPLIDTSYASGSLWGKKIKKRNDDSEDVPSYTSVAGAYTSVDVPSYTSVDVPSYTPVDVPSYTLDMFMKQKKNKK